MKKMYRLDRLIIYEDGVPEASLYVDNVQHRFAVEPKEVQSKDVVKDDLVFRYRHLKRDWLWSETSAYGTRFGNLIK